MARLKIGLDVWECSCGAIIAMGRLCGCGKSYADILRENSGIREKKKEVKKDKSLCFQIEIKSSSISLNHESYHFISCNG